MMKNENHDPFKNCEAFWDAADFIPWDLLVSHWCDNDNRCKEAKTAALVTALVHQTVEAINQNSFPVEGDYQNILYQVKQNKVLVNRESFRRWAIELSESQEERNKAEHAARPNQNEASASKTLGAVLSLLFEEKTPKGSSYSSFDSQNMLITTLEATYNESHKGLSQSSLEKIFAQAKKSFKNA